MFVLKNVVLWCAASETPDLTSDAHRYINNNLSIINLYIFYLRIKMTVFCYEIPPSITITLLRHILKYTSPVNANTKIVKRTHKKMFVYVV